MKDVWQKRLERHALLIVLLSASLFALPLFLYFTPTLDSGDLLFYKIALTEFSRQFWSGQPYPRWLTHVNDGMGSPVFVFLGPGAYYPTVLLQWLAAIDPEGTVRFILSVLAARMLAGVLCFRWLCSHFSRGQALLITVLFLTIPYTIHEIYVRSELAGQWAFSCMFITFIALDGLMAQQRIARSFVLIACASCAHILIHLPTFVTFGWLAFLYILWLSPAPKRMVMLLQVMAATCCAVALSAFYMLPLWLNKEFINADHYFNGQYSFSANYLVHPNEIYCFPYFLLAACAAIFAWGTKFPAKKMVHLQLAVILVVAFMVLPISAFVWKLLLPLQFLQFPFRFLNVALLPFAVVAAYHILHSRLRPLVIVLWLCGLVLHGYVIYAFAPHDTSGVLRLIPEHKLITLKEYRTKWQQDYNLLQQNVANDVYRKLPPVELAKGGAGIIKNLPSSADTIAAAVTMLKPGTVIFHQFYFPHMEVRDSQTDRQYEAIPYGEDGRLAVALPAGSFTLQTRTGWLKGERAGVAISLVTAIFLLSGMIIARKRKAI